MDKTNAAVMRLSIRSIILQLQVLEAQLAKGEQVERFEDLEGIWAGADFSYEEIKAAEIKAKEFPQ